MAWWENKSIKVDRPASILPQTVATPGTAYFTVVGGYVMVTGLLGIFTVAVGGGAVDATWCHNPDAGVDTDLCLATALAGAVAAGYMLSVSGVVGDGMLPLAGSMAQIMAGVLGGQSPMALGPGDMGVFTGASRTGNWRWICWYKPIDQGATVIAA